MTCRWPTLLAGSALAHGAVIVALPLAPLDSLINSSIVANDQLSVTLVQISQPTVDERHPARRPLFDPRREIVKPVDAAVVDAASTVQTEIPSATSQLAAPQIAIAVLEKPHTQSEVIAEPETVDIPNSKPETAPVAANTPTQKMASATTEPAKQTEQTAPVAEITSPVREPEPVEAQDVDSDDELEDDDSAPYVEQTPAAQSASATAVEVVMQSTTETSFAADAAAAVALTANDTTVAALNVEQLSVAATPASTSAPAAAPETIAPTGSTDTFDESEIRREIRARFDHDLVYPPLARKRGWEGNVNVMLRVSRHGNIEVLEVVESSGFGILDRYTRKTLEHIRLDDQFLESLQASYRDLRIEVQYLLIAARG